MVNDVNFDKENEAFKILKAYRRYIRKNHPLFYANRSYFFKITKAIYELSPKYEYFDRNSLKKKLTIIEEGKIRKCVNRYFQKTYNLDVSNLKYFTLSDEINSNSMSYYDYDNDSKVIKILINNNIQDCFVMVHEFRHYLNIDKNSNFVQTYLTEALSIFEELNFYYYIKNENVVSDEELNLVNKMTFVRHSIISKRNLAFFRLDSIINDNGKISYSKEIYHNIYDIQEDIYSLIKEYKNNGLQYHDAILYNLGILIASSIMQNIKNNKISFRDFEKLNDKLSSTSSFNVLHLVKVDINDVECMLENYKKELEDIFDIF